MRFTGTDLSSGEEFAEVYHYDSMGNISGIVTSAGEYAALYAGKGRPRYWERFVSPGPDARPGVLPAEGQPETIPDALSGEPASSATQGFNHFSFQWNEEGLLVRLTGGGPGSGDVTETDVRYEYVRDERGNWIERRDTPMIRRSGFLVPGPAERLIRRIEYSAP
jgi:hypothetical protein